MSPTPSPDDRAAINRVRSEVYDSAASSYDEGMDLFERLILGSGHRAWAASRAVGVTLEAAIGTALNLPHYASDVQLTGLDISPGMLRMARGRAMSLGRDIELVEGDIHAIPFRDGSFDAVVCTYALCSVADDSLAISEMRRVLRPGGRLLLVDHVRSTAPPVYWLQKAYERLPRRNRGEYMTRRPAVHVLEGDCDVVLDERFRWGVVERLMAIKPA